MSKLRYWLASSSPRRREILSWTHLPFQVIAVDVDESLQENESVEKYVKRLAAEKARAASIRVNSKDIIIAADTTVVLDQKIIGKPANISEAFGMLRALRGKCHQVITAICVVQPSANFFVIDRCISTVHMRIYSDAEVAAYVNSGDPLDKAGAYAIQHPQFDPVINFNGCYACVMGMPLCHLERNLRPLKDYIWQDMSKICRKNLDYTCPIHSRVIVGEDIG